MTNINTFENSNETTNEKQTPTYNDALNALNTINNQYVKSESVRKPETFQKPLTEVTPKVERILESGYGYSPFADNEDIIARNTSGLAKITKGLGKLVLTTGTKLGSSVGFLGALATSAIAKAIDTDKDYISMVADNAVSKAFDSWEKDIKESRLFGTFQEAVDRDKGFWSRATTDIDFWTDDVVDGIAFMASAWVPGIALSKINLGTKAMKAFSKAVKATSGVDDAIESTGLAYKIYKNAKQYGEYIDGFNSWALASSSEAMFEAKGVKDKILESLADDDTISQEEKEKIAGGNARNAFVMNLALLGITNIFEAKLVHKFTKGSTSKAGETIGGETFFDKLSQKAGATSRFGKLLERPIVQGALTVGKGVVREGYIEENAQLAIQRMYEKDGAAKKVGSVLGLENFVDFGTQLVRQTYKSFTGNTAEDRETAASIGIGGIIGGGSNILMEAVYGEKKKEKINTEKAIEAYNKSQVNFLKFGNIYKTETVEVTDSEGKKVKKEKFVKDAAGNLVEDEDKIKMVLGENFKLDAQLNVADKAANAIVKQKLKDAAFGDFVIAHIQAGKEDGIIEKLNKLATASPEELAQLGFTPNEKSKDEIGRYKTLASRILKQNEILNNSVTLRNNDKLDQARKTKLVDLGTRQAVERTTLLDIEQKNSDLGSILFEGSKATTNSLVDQLNTIKYRIDDYEKEIESLKTNNPEKKAVLKTITELLNNLKNEKKTLEKNNELSIKKLEKHENGFYLHEEDAVINNPALRNYFMNIATIAYSKNSIESLGREWATYADEINGRESFQENFINQQIVATVNKEIEKENAKKEEEKKTVTKEIAKKLYTQLRQGKKLDEFTPDEQLILNDDLIITKEIKDEVEKELNPPPPPPPPVNTYKEGDVFVDKDGVKYKINSIDVVDGVIFVNDEGDSYTISDFEEAIKNGILSLENAPPLVIIPPIDIYLEEIYNDLLNNVADFKLTYKEWVDNGDADPYITEYNNKYGQSVKLKKKVSVPEKTDLEKVEEEINKANFKNINLNNITNISNTISKWLSVIGDNEILIQKIKNKLNEINNEVVRKAVEKLFFNTETTQYVDPIEKGAKIKRSSIRANADGVIEINPAEMFTGFIVKGILKFMTEIASLPGSLEHKLKAVASKKLAKKYAEDAASLNIENRTAITFESQDEINTKLKKGKSVIAVGNKVDGFSIQLYANGVNNPENLYIQSIDTYYIVHPDNTTEKVVFSEEQRSFVKENMRFEGKKLTNEQFDKLQNIYNKLQEFNKEVEVLMQDNESLDITPIFNRYFSTSTSGLIANVGDNMEKVIANNPENLFAITVAIMDEDGNLTFEDRNVPVFAYKKASLWISEFSLNSNERVVKVINRNDQNEVVDYEDVYDVNEFLKSEFGVEVKLDNKFPSPYAWISKETDKKGNNFPHALQKLKGTEPVKMFKGFYKSLNDLKNAIEEGNKTGEYIYKGVKYSTLSKMIVEYNKNHYGFFKSTGWLIDISYDSKAKKFVFEMRPEESLLNRSEWNAKNSQIKGNLNLYLRPISEIKDDATDEDIINIYNNWVNDTITDFNNLITKNQESNNADLRELALRMDPRILFFYENEMDGGRSWRLKMVDKTLSATLAPNLVFNNPKTKQVYINVSLKEETPVAASTQTPSSTSRFGSGYVLTDENTISEEELQKQLGQPESTSSSSGKRKITKKKDNESAFMLEENSEIEKYTEESFNEEAKWLAEALKTSGIQIKELGSIVDNLITKKRVLGFYKDQAIYVDAMTSARGTIYHEAFHGLFRNIFTPKEREFYLAKAKEKLGKVKQSEIDNFRWERNYTTKTDAEIVDLMAEEYLAEGFRKYKLDGKTPKEGFLAKFVKLLERIINFFKRNNNAINDLYKTFDEGGFSNRQYLDINKEGAYSLVYGRPRLELVDNELQYDDAIPMNLDVYSEVVNRLAYEVANNHNGDFSEKFDVAVEKLKKEYDIENLVMQAATPELAQAIRSKYQVNYLEASFALGKQVPYILDDAIINDDDAMAALTELELGAETLSKIKDEVRDVIKTLGLTTGFNSEQLEMKESEEDLEERKKSGEFDTVHLNPLTGISSEFRSLFSLIPYTYVDPELGVKIQRTADGAMLFNAMMKVSSNSSAEKIIPNLVAAVTSMQEDNDQYSAPLLAFVEFLGDRFGIVDILNNPSNLPTRNHFLYNQLIDTFFATELNSYQIIHDISNGVPTAMVKDASISEDIANKYQTIKHLYEKKQRTLLTNEEIAEFNKNFDKLKTFIKENVNKQGEKDPLIKITNRDSLNKLTNELKKLFDNVNLFFPKHLIRQSLLAIYSIERDGVISENSKKSINDLNVNSALFKEEAYLHSKFFDFITQIDSSNYSKLFANTKDKTTNVGKQKEQIDGINAIIKKASKFIIKYDINSAISVYQNAENKKIWRYTRYTPPVLLAQAVRENGAEILGEFYPALQSYFKDNPLFDDNLENKLYLENFNIGMFGGFRQDLDGQSRDGVTFGSIDSKTLLLSNIVNFMNRNTITKRMKNSKGVKENVNITVFNRSRTQEEGTTTNYLVTAKYNKYTDLNGNITNSFVDIISKMLRQEYNRIAREWALRNDDTITRYTNYNEKTEGDADFIIKNGKKVEQRAYKFEVFKHFFNQNTENVNNLQERLKKHAKDNLVFEDIFKDDLKQLFDIELNNYMKSDFQIYYNELLNTGLIAERKTTEGTLGEPGYNETVETISGFIPTKLKIDISSDTIDKFGYSDLKDLLFDHHLNVYASKITSNQIFDGDIATGIKSQTEYFKRNKSGVISGNSMKVGEFTVAFVENLTVSVNEDNLLDNTSDTEFKDSKKVDVADGQAYNRINHVIKMFNSWGRLDNEVRELLNESKFRELTVSEVQKLESKKVILNSKKTAVGGIFEYYKMSEHLIIRSDVSYLDTKGMSKSDAENRLRELHNEIDILEDQLYKDLKGAEANDLESRIVNLYKEVHSFWKPKRSREKLHYLLNSMELDLIDMVMDPNTSKKTTIVPVKLNTNDVTNLKPSKSSTLSIFKFMQVETAGMHDRITHPTQARQLLTTYLDKIENDATYSGKTLQELAKEFSQILGNTIKASTTELDKLMTNEDGSLNVGLIFKTIQRGLLKQGADSNTLKFFDLKDGVPVHNPNLPTIKKQFTYYYFSLFNDAIFSRDLAGRSDIHVSSYGYDVLYNAETNEIITNDEYVKNPSLYNDKDKFKTRHLGIKKEVVNGKNVYYVECILPKHLSNNPLEQKLFLEKMNTFFSTRIPTEDKRSMVVLKVVDYISHSYRNSIIVPQAVHILAGSDLDVDKLYSHAFDYYMDFNDVPHVYGDYSNYPNESQGRFIEYMEYMSKSKSLKDLIELEYEKIEDNIVIPNEFVNLAEELGILFENIPTTEELQEQRKSLQSEIEKIEKEKKRLKEIHDIEFTKFIESKKDKEQRKKFNDSRNDYVKSRAALNEKEDELELLKVYQKQLQRTLKLIATYNVLKYRKYPTSQKALTDYIKKNGFTPVIPVMDNRLLQIKIDILSNEEVFNNYYIKEKSNIEKFKKVAESIGAEVSDIINQNSIYSIMGDVVANKLNSSSKEGLGNTAAFNKFLSFAQKNKLEISPIFNTREKSTEVDKKGNIKTVNKDVVHYSFQDEEAIGTIGNTIGMFADSAKDPIPSVLNLNPDTSFSSNILSAIGIDLQHALLINKIPLIENRIKLIQNSSANVKSNTGERPLSIRKEFRDIRKELFEVINDNGLLDLLFEKDEKGELDFSRLIPVYLIKEKPTNLSKLNENDITLKNLGISFEYENESEVSELIGLYHIVNNYIEMNNINGDIIKLTRILNLIKDQKPDFALLDQLLEDVDYFLSGESFFADSIVDALSNNVEYLPLIEAAKKMSDYSKELLIERTTLYKNIIKNLYNTFNPFSIKTNDKQKLNDQITQYVITNKVKVDLVSRINELENINNKTESQNVELETLKNSIKYFESDYWINNNTLTDDLDYLYETHKGNAFVEFLKTTTRRNLEYLEVASRIKLDKDLSRNILNGYESLQKSKDKRTLMLSRQMFYYLVAKDGLGYGTNTFLGYISADFGVGSYKMASFKAVSDMLSEFQILLLEQEKESKKVNKQISKIENNPSITNEAKKQEIEKLLNANYEQYAKQLENYFKSKKGDDHIINMMKKIYSYAGNQKYINVSKTFKIKNVSDELKEEIKDFINLGMISSIEPLSEKDKLPNQINIFQDNKDITIDFSTHKNNFSIDFFENITKLKVVADPIDRSKVLGFNFPTLIRNGAQDKEGDVFILTELNGVKITGRDVFISLLHKSMAGNTNFGLKAKYTIIKPEGSRDLSNFGMTSEDAIKIYEKTKPEVKEDDSIDSFFANYPYTNEDDVYSEAVGTSINSNDNYDVLNNQFTVDDPTFWDEMNNGDLENSLTNEEKTYTIEDPNLWQDLENELNERKSSMPPPVEYDDSLIIDSKRLQPNKYVKITNFYNSLSEIDKKKVGSLEDVIRKWNEIPFEYSEEEFIDDIKCDL